METTAAVRPQQPPSGPAPRPGRVLFISNGHGEDNHSAHIIRQLQHQAPQLEIAALPIVGSGGAYRRVGVPIIGPTQAVLPSGGFSYMDRRLLLADIRAGLLGLTWRQFRALRRQAHRFDLVHATGDSVGQSFAWLSGRPYISFISCLSALYEGHLRLDAVLPQLIRSRRCRVVFTRDPFTAEDLRRQGFAKVRFGGIPSLDWITPQGRDLDLVPGQPMVGLLPGSRLPEAERNLQLMLRFVAEASRRMAAPPAFRAALVGALQERLPALAAAEGWQVEGERLVRTLDNGTVAEIRAPRDAFNDIALGCTLVIGMAGLAVDQVVALGKPVIQFAGEGPQFTHAFAEAQDRLLGPCCRTIGTGPAGPAELIEGARVLEAVLSDADYLERCRHDGRARLGAPDGSRRIATAILDALESRP
ncbi:MAG: lipid-A-disaccharide synthase-related protein [Prochlorococcaceae cyanobacterium]|jgi:uncharacterized protein (TIGR03492 family)